MNKLCQNQDVKTDSQKGEKTRQEPYQSVLFRSILNIHDYLKMVGVKSISEPTERLIIQKDLAIVQEELSITKDEAWVFSVLLSDFIDNRRTLSPSSIQRIVNSNNRTTLDIGHVMLDLCQKGFLYSPRYRWSWNYFEVNFMGRMDYEIPESVMHFVLTGNSMTNDRINDGFDVLRWIGRITSQVDQWSPSGMDTIEKVNSLLIDFNHIPIVSAINDLGIDDESALNVLFLLFGVVDERSITIGEIAEACHKSKVEQLRVWASLKSKSGVLFERGLVQTIIEEDTGQQVIHLSDEGEKLLDHIDENLRTVLQNKTVKPTVLRPIFPKEIEETPLFFDGTTEDRLNELKMITNTCHFQEIQNRMKEKGMRGGLNILLSGSSGTGKTELVKQIVRQNDCVLLLVEMSKIKGRYVGDSERAVKDIFQEYASFKRQEQNVPILVLNEADAIITKRHNESSSSNPSVVNLLNGIQNILLQEMEDFDGILVATTNRPHSFDDAFSRRFLYQFDIPRPDTQVRNRIWEYHFPNLGETEIEKLSDYDFTGANVANIATISINREILFGDSTNYESLISLCEEFKSSTYRKAIGF